jgi:hypothetical protein
VQVDVRGVQAAVHVVLRQLGLTLARDRELARARPAKVASAPTAASAISQMPDAPDRAGLAATPHGS